MAGELETTRLRFLFCARCGSGFEFEYGGAGRLPKLCADCFGTPDGETATCVRCGETKVVSEFSRDPSKSNGLRSYCVQCDRDKAQEWAQANPERVRANARAWYARNSDRFRDYDLKRHYGITQADYDEMLEMQGGRCAICSTDDPRGHGKFHVDHDHETDAVRGLLCHACNLALGGFQDDAELLARAIAYLEEHT